MLLKIKLVCRKFYILSWNEELLTKICFHAFGYELYDQIKYKVAKRLYKVQNNIEDKPRYFVETDTEEENSDSFGSDDNDRAHHRQDNNSSADDENALKDYFRRNAREEYEVRKIDKEFKKDKVRDMKIIEKHKFDRVPLPTELKEKYKDDLSEFRQ